MGSNSSRRNPPMTGSVTGKQVRYVKTLGKDLALKRGVRSSRITLASGCRIKRPSLLLRPDQHAGSHTKRARHRHECCESTSPLSVSTTMPSCNSHFSSISSRCHVRGSAGFSSLLLFMVSMCCPMCSSRSSHLCDPSNVASQNRQALCSGGKRA